LHLWDWNGMKAQGRRICSVGRILTNWKNLDGCRSVSMKHHPHLQHFISFVLPVTAISNAELNVHVDWEKHDWKTPIKMFRLNIHGLVSTLYSIIIHG
jgi:hypothetical protein